MAKLKLNEFKKFLSSLQETELRAELQKRLNKLSQVQEFYAQELILKSERKIVLQGYKDKIYKQFWTSKVNPPVPSNAAVRKLISDFEKIAVSNYELI
jgi:hypothetical protein